MPEGRRQGGVDVRTAAGVDPVCEAQGGVGRFRFDALQLGAERFDLGIVGDDIERVGRLELMDQEFDGLSGLLNLLTAHASRTVDDDHDRLGSRRGLRRLQLGAGQQHEIAVFGIFRPEADEAHADGPGVRATENPQIVGRLHVAQAELASRVTVVGPLKRHRVGRAVDRLDRVGRFEPEGDVQRLDRVIGVLERSQGKQEIDEAAVFSQQLRIADSTVRLACAGMGKTLV